MNIPKSSTWVLAVVLLFATVDGYALQPFFDTDPLTRHAPPEPNLTDFDLDVLSLCGAWGGEVEARDFERMMLKPENAAALERIRNAVGSRIYGKAEDGDEFVRQLRRVWFEQKGFKHVFCGEPGQGPDLGGFHYAARYWEAQDRGWAGYRKLEGDFRKRPVAKCREPYLREKIAPPVYTLSVEFSNPRRPKNNVKCLTGYHHQMDAERILIAGTQAFKQANKRVAKNAKEACLFETRLDGVSSHYSTLVIKQRALRTFFPLADKRPYCRKDKKDFRACLCSKL